MESAVAAVIGIEPGPGRALVERFAQAGMQVAVAARNRDRPDALQVAARKSAVSRGPNALLAPQAIAEACHRLHLQHRSAWTHEPDLRPWVERF